MLRQKTASYKKQQQQQHKQAQRKIATKHRFSGSTASRRSYRARYETPETRLVGAEAGAAETRRSEKCACACLGQRLDARRCSAFWNRHADLTGRTGEHGPKEGGGGRETRIAEIDSDAPRGKSAPRLPRTPAELPPQGARCRS